MTVFLQDCHRDLEDKCSLLLLPGFGRQEEPAGQRGASSEAKSFRFSSQSPLGCTKAVLLMQQVTTAKGSERQPRDRGCLSVASASSHPVALAQRGGRKQTRSGDFWFPFEIYIILCKNWLVRAAK